MGDFFRPLWVSVPVEARTKRTMFRWKQEGFGGSAEYWAMNNIRVYRQLPEGWEDTKTWAATKVTPVLMFYA
jgi:hypothetical protein